MITVVIAFTMKMRWNITMPQGSEIIYTHPLYTDNRLDV
jgi:hypothetical protein